MPLTPDLSFELGRLVNKLPTLIRGPDQKPRIWKEFQSTLVQALVSTIQNPTARETLAARFTRESISPASLVQSNTLTAMGAAYGYSSPETLADLRSAASMLDTAGNPHGALMGVLNGCGGYIQRTDLAPETYQAIVEIISPTIAYAERSEYWEIMVSAKWILFVALKRLANYSACIDVLCEIRALIDERRQLIRDPRLRAGIMVYLPRLYESSAELLQAHQPKNFVELFQVVEGAKSKILAELVQQKRGLLGQDPGDEGDDPEISSLQRVQMFLKSQPVPSCYMTALVGELAVYMICVDAQGRVFADKLALTNERIETACRHLQVVHQGSRGKPKLFKGAIDPDHPHIRDYTAVQTALRPLAIYLQKKLQEKVLQVDHHVYFAPDGPLYNIPLQMIQVGNQPFIDYCRISQIPSASVLLSCQQVQPLFDPTRVLACMVPVGADLEHLEHFYKDVHLLQTHEFSVTILDHEHADLSQLQTVMPPGGLVHFGTHGTFDKRKPLEGSGLLIADEGTVPGASTQKKPSDYLLTADKFSTLELVGSHVTIRACVSGNVTQITSREALGVLWALFQGGVGSTLVASWNVDLMSAVDLVQGFYKYWLVLKHDKAGALRQAIQDLRQQKRAYDHPYHWAPFVLYGY